jgi:hypothetical protein
MKERIVKNWISSAIGIGLIVGACIALWFGKVNVDGLLLIIPVGAGFLFSKDKLPFSKTDVK